MPKWYTDLEAALEAETDKSQAAGFILYLCSKVLRGIHPRTEALERAIPQVNAAAAVTGHRIEDIFPPTPEPVAVIVEVQAPPAETDAPTPEPVTTKGKKAKTDAA